MAMKWIKEVEKEAQLVANQFAIDFPPSRLASASSKHGSIDSQAGKAILNAEKESGRYQRASRLGVIKKVIFARAFQRQMKSLGYTGASIRTVTAKVLAAMSCAS